MQSTKNISVSNLSIGYQQKIVAKNINFSLEKGKFVALLGKNGSGKSTLLRTISNVQPSISGEVAIQQKNLKEYSPNELAKHISLVLTDKLPESQLTVFELVALGRQPYTNWIDKLSSIDIEKINYALKLTEIEHLKTQKHYQLSDGQLQRVLIARALAQDTEIIILDEPTAHLDIHHKFQVFSLLKKLVYQTGKTILISTHEVNLALQLANKFILISEQKIKTGTKEKLIQQNAFDNLFPKGLILFDKTQKQFRINKI